MRQNINFKVDKDGNITDGNGKPLVLYVSSSSSSSNDAPKLSNILAEYFCIPCDLCHKCFKCSDCPKCVERCNGKQHWRMLLERIIDNEKD